MNRMTATKEYSMAGNESKAWIIKADGTEVPLDHRPTYEETVKIIKGYMVIVTCPNTLNEYHRVLTMYVDEDGRCKPNQVKNVKASAISGHYIVGDVLMLMGWRALAPQKAVKGG
jgi:hypothetical protein